MEFNKEKAIKIHNTFFDFDNMTQDGSFCIFYKDFKWCWQDLRISDDIGRPYPDWWQEAISKAYHDYAFNRVEEILLS